MTAIAGTVGLASAPKAMLRVFGVNPHDVTGAAELGWRLFAVRTGYLAVLAAQGNTTARDAFLPVQVLDQVVFWHVFATRAVPPRAAVLAAATSGALVALDLQRRRQAR